MGYCEVMITKVKASSRMAFFYGSFPSKLPLHNTEPNARLQVCQHRTKLGHCSMMVHKNRVMNITAGLIININKGMNGLYAQ